MTQTREKWDFIVLSRADFWNGMKVLWYSVFSFLFFCLEPTVKKNTWMRTTSFTITVIFLKVPLGKLLNHSHVLTFFSTITMHIHNGIWKTPYSRRLYRHRSTYAIILISVKIMKQKSTKVIEKLSVAQKSGTFFRSVKLITFIIFRRYSR